MEVWKIIYMVVTVLIVRFATDQTCIHSFNIELSRPERSHLDGSHLVGQQEIPPRYKFDLDLPAEDRWAPILEHYNKTVLVKMIKDALATVLPREVFPLVDFIGTKLDKYMPAPYAGEIKGIAQSLSMSVGEIFAMNILYEATAFCTSIVAVDSNNMVWHGRNLDYDFADILRNTTIVLDFQRNNQTIFTSTSYLGSVGIFTGLKPNVFTVSIDERHKGNIYENIMGLLGALMDNNITSFVSFLTREALEHDDTFKKAYNRLVYTRIIAPTYYILGGVKPDEGVVITRSRLTSLDINILVPSMDKWFVLETNYDRWTTPPPSDDRRDPAIASMKAVGRQNINNHTMFQVLSKPPVLNNKTTYTTLMSAARPDLFQTFIRRIH